MNNEALSGIVVTEIGLRSAVGICGSLLAQLGATVIAVEPKGGRPTHRALFTADKLSFELKGNAEADTQLLRDLIARSDVILTSSDVDQIRLQDLNVAGSPVICDTTAFGASGANAGLAWSEQQIQALSGIADTTGFDDGPPVAIEVPITDFLTAAYAAAATVGAVRVRRLSGAGQRIDMALFDCAFAALNSFLSSVLAGSTLNTSRLGNRHPKVAPWNLYKSRDGWALICAGNETQWKKLCEIIERPDFLAAKMTMTDRLKRTPEVDQAIEKWTSQHTTEECINTMVDAAIACGPIAPIEDYPREANIDYRKMVRRIFDPMSGKDVFIPRFPIGMSEPAGTDRIPALDGDRAAIEKIAAEKKTSLPQSKPKRVLDGIRIIEIGQFTTAPLCTRHLAHLGAEVIKIEPLEGAESRPWPPVIQGTSTAFRLNNSDKRSIALDLRSPHGAQVLAKLLETADVLVENLKPGSLAKLGFSAEKMAQINPKLVYCAISGFGADSLYATRPAFDMVIQAMAGFMTALSGGTPLKSGISTSDLMGAEMAILAVLAAIEKRDRTNEGQYIDLSMQDISTWLTQTAWNGTKATPPVMQRCKDGYVLAEASAEDVAKALQTIDVSTLDRSEVCNIFEAANIRCAPVLTVEESVNLPHTLQRRLHYTMRDNGEDWPMLSCPLQLLGTPPQITWLAPSLDQDGPAILAELGIDAPVKSAAEARRA